MKKSILFLFALFPILASCSSNDNGFVNPFPNDPYESEKIGFNFAQNEIIKRTLTTSENELLDYTISKKDIINAGLILRDEGEIHERDYTRAFAGVFRDGYDASNMMYDETFVTFYQKEGENPDSKKTDRTRKRTTNVINSTYDYSYGRNVVKDAKSKTITYLAKKDAPKEGEPITYSELEGKLESITEEDTVKAVTAKYETLGTTDNRLSYEFVSKDEEIGTALLPYFYVSQIEIAQPSPSDPIPGANAYNDVVLVKEEHKPYGDKGEYVLPDGRKYSAINNSLSVTVLTKTIDETEGGVGDYYLVSSYRTYTETVITSNVIQPNVPIEFLKKPIVINYKEEFHHFSNELTGKDSSSETLESIEVVE